MTVRRKLGLLCACTLLSACAHQAAGLADDVSDPYAELDDLTASQMDRDHTYILFEVWLSDVCAMSPGERAEAMQGINPNYQPPCEKVRAK